MKSSNEISSSMRLLNIVLIKKLKAITYKSIENELKNIDCTKIEKLTSDIYNFIEANNLKNSKIYDDDYVYDWNYKIVCTSLFFEEKKKKIPKTCKSIDNNFYDGFGII